MESLRRVTFSVLGPLEARGPGGAAVTIGQAKKRRLLSLLLLNAGRWVSVERIRDALWDDLPPPSATGNIKTYVSALRQTIPTGRIEGRPGAYRLGVAPEEIDVWHFEDGARRGQESRWAGDDEAAVSWFGEALALWRGQPYDDLPENMTKAETARLCELYAMVNEDLIDSLIKLGHYDQALPMLRALTVEYPLRERLWAQLLVAEARCGHRAEALAAYRTAYRLLSEELGVEPGKELRWVHEQLLNGSCIGDEPACPTIGAGTAVARPGRC